MHAGQHWCCLALLAAAVISGTAAQGEVKGVAIETWTYEPKVHFASTFFDTDPELPGPWSTNSMTSTTQGQITNTLDSSCLAGNGCQVSQRITTWVKITEAGKSYNFQITCADGGILYLDGSAIVNKTATRRPRKRAKAGPARWVSATTS